MTSAPVAAAAPVAAGSASGASKAEIAEAERYAKLMLWAAKTTAAQGSPQAGMMQAKADQAVAALEALKAGESAPSAPVASVRVAAAPTVAAVASSAPSKAELAEAEKHAKLLLWAAKTTATQGSPQAGMMQAKADAAVAALEALKAGSSA